MKLFLASSIKHETSISSLDKFVSGLKNKKVAYVVTAGNGEGWGSWKGETFDIVKSHVGELKIIQLEDYWNKNVIDDLHDIDILWFVGGYAGYLMYWLRRTKLDKEIKNILNRDVVYVGSSAGSWIASNNLEVPEIFIDEEEVGASIIPGLGLVDFDIYPHYDEKDYQQIKTLYKGKKLYLLKNGEQIIVDGGKIIVDGVERIIVNK